MQQKCYIKNGGSIMPKIMKLSALRNYTEVLEDVQPGEPVYLTKNGEGRYAIIDIEEYESLRRGLWQRLFAELEESIQVAERFGWIDEKKADAFIDGLMADGKA
jgi:prevent-host-death family protein